MTRPFAICLLFTAATFCLGDDQPARLDNAADSPADYGPFRDASPEELKQLSEIDEPAAQILTKYLGREIAKYEARISQLEKQVASQSSSNPPPLSATVRPVDALAQASHSAGLTPSPYATSRPESSAKSPQSSPFTPAKTWQRINLHGAWFYIVPVEHVDAFTPPQSK
jgi:hypothetical protein